MTTVTKADIEHQLVGYLTIDGLHDRPLPTVRRAIVVAAGIIAEALGLEDAEDAEELVPLIELMRRCCKVRECDRMDLAASVRAVMRDDIVGTLSDDVREKLGGRLTEALAELARLE
ncbi:MAG: hypothetical protein ACYCS7_03850 [Acidimicrobiales bacterium]